MTKTTVTSVVNITVKEMIEILKLQMRGTFSNFHIETEPKMSKTDNPYFGQIVKITKGNILLGCSHQDRMRKETGDDSFVSGENKVGNHIGEGMCVLYNENTGRHYLQYEWFEQVRPKSEYRFNGNPIEKQLFQSYMGTFVPREVLTQSVNMNNIVTLTLNHTKYVLTDKLPDTPKPKEKKVRRPKTDGVMGMMEQ